jgi:hypothetical protein
MMSMELKKIENRHFVYGLIDHRHLDTQVHAKLLNLN